MHKAASGLRSVGHHTAKPLQQFDARLRSVLGPALDLAVSHPFEGELPVDALPDWFTAAAQKTPASAPAHTLPTPRSTRVTL